MYTLLQYTVVCSHSIVRLHSTVPIYRSVVLCENAYLTLEVRFNHERFFEVLQVTVGFLHESGSTQSRGNKLWLKLNGTLHVHFLPFAPFWRCFLLYYATCEIPCRCRKSRQFQIWNQNSISTISSKVILLESIKNCVDALTWLWR